MTAETQQYKARQSRFLRKIVWKILVKRSQINKPREKERERDPIQMTQDRKKVTFALEKNIIFQYEKVERASFCSDALIARGSFPIQIGEAGILLASSRGGGSLMRSKAQRDLSRWADASCKNSKEMPINPTRTHKGIAPSTARTVIVTPNA